MSDQSPRPCVYWLTGIPGSGKSTIANDLATALRSTGKSAFVLDGDELRNGLNSDLGFEESDRHENSRRVIEVAKLLTEAGLIVIVALISPYEVDRRRARSEFPEADFFEIFVNTPLEICKERDPKGHYKRANKGEISDFTGVSHPYEVPTKPDLAISGVGEISKNRKLILELL